MAGDRVLSCIRQSGRIANKTCAAAWTGGTVTSFLLFYRFISENLDGLRERPSARRPSLKAELLKRRRFSITHQM